MLLSTTRQRLSAAAAVALALGAGASGCTVAGEDESAADRCQEVIEFMAQCYPDLASDAECTAETVGMFDGFDLGSQGCDAIDGMGKADIFAWGGCGMGQHVCGWIFCCDDYTLNWFPQSEEDWNIVSVVQTLHAAAPADAAADLEQASWAELREGYSVSYTQEVAEYPNGERRNMAVEMTRVIVSLPYDEFVAALPVQDWGIQLDHYLGGEVRVYETDTRGRATRQLERMVLSPFPCDYESTLSNNDMTKVEVIDYGSDWGTVYWRVMFSDNDSTEVDVGSVDFRAYDSGHTQITFHSAHRLNAPGGIHIPSHVLEPALRQTFLDFVRHYRDQVER